MGEIHLAGHAVRLPERQREGIAGQRHGLAVELVGVAAVELEVPGGHLDVGPGLGQRLARVERLRAGEVLGVAADQRGNGEQVLAPLKGRQAAPCRLGGPGGGHGVVDVLGPGRGHLGQRGASGRVEHRGAGTGPGGPGGTVDDQVDDVDTRGRGGVSRRFCDEGHRRLLKRRGKGAQAGSGAEGGVTPASPKAPPMRSPAMRPGL